MGSAESDKFESYVVYDGSQTLMSWAFYLGTFESYVVYDGSQTTESERNRMRKFES